MKLYKILITGFFLFFITVSYSFSETKKNIPVTITQNYTAFKAYEKGFARNVMHDSRGVRLFDMELLEDDSPGAGFSEKGSFLQPIYGRIMARKDIYISDIRTNGVFLVFYVMRAGSKPLSININGHEISYESKDTNWRTLSFDSSWLIKGKNTIIISCPEAAEEDTWKLWIARQDEFERGGGDASIAGLNSFVSTDGGMNWKRNILGETGDVIGEFCMRLSLDRYLKEGFLASPVIDLWRDELDGFIIPISSIDNLSIKFIADVPTGTNIIWQVRFGNGPDPLAEYWSEFKEVGKGEKLSETLVNPGRRYFQWKAVLTTESPIKTPAVHSVEIKRDVTRINVLPDNIYLLDVENPEIIYSSLYGEYEKWDEPKLKKLRERERLDEITAGCKTQFEMMVKLCDYVSKRWDWVPPFKQYPPWDAIEILDRIEKEGGGGMCIHFAIVLIQALESYGIQARLQNCVGHEVVEAWSDDYGKWVFFDPMQGSNVYNYSKVNGEPLGFKELHKIYLDLFYPNSSIDWEDNNAVESRKIPPDALVGAGTFDKNWPRSEGSDEKFLGLANAAFMRMMPRNNWMEKHNPSPLGHGLYGWFWNGYINWYDDRTPRMRQFGNFTDREADYFPTLNRVKIYAVTGPENDRLFLRFTTFTPNFDTYLVEIDEGEWIPTSEYFPWVLHSGLNRLRVRVRNMSGTLGKPSLIKLNLADRPNLTDRPDLKD